MSSNVSSSEEVLKITRTFSALWLDSIGVEKAEWVNKIIEQLWPSFQGYLMNTLTQEVAPLLRSKSKLLESFQFTDKDFGNTPPKILGVKVYDRDDKRIVLDLDAIYDSPLKITVSLKHLKAGVVDFHFRGLVRVELLPLANKIPFVAACGVSFVNEPKIGFDLTELANLFDMPGLDSLFRAAINDLIKEVMVYPKKIVVKITEEDNVDIYPLKFPSPKGVLRVDVKKASNLSAEDPGFGSQTSDPYVKVFVGNEFKFKTSVSNNNLNPVWDECFDVLIEDWWQSEVKIFVIDKDYITSDDSLGNTSIPVKTIKEKGVVEEWFDLQNKQGKILMSFAWGQLSNDVNHLENAIKLAESHENTSSACLSIYVDKANNLPEAYKDSEFQVNVSIEGKKESFKTKMVPFSNPVWDERFLTLLRNPFGKRLTFEVESNKGFGGTIGKESFLIEKLTGYENMEVNEKLTIVHSGCEFTITMRLCLHVLKFDSESLD